MLMRVLVVSMAIALFGSSHLVTGSKQAPATPSAYVRLEVKGTLRKDGVMHYVETSDGEFSQTPLLVKLERSEDKNRSLDRHLEGMQEKKVVVRGFLDCRRVGQETGVIYLYLSSESQIQPSNESR